MRKLHLKLNICDGDDVGGKLFKAFLLEDKSNANVFRVSEQKLIFEVFFDTLSEKITEAISSISFSDIDELFIEEANVSEQENAKQKTVVESQNENSSVLPKTDDVGKNEAEQVPVVESEDEDSTVLQKNDFLEPDEIEQISASDIEEQQKTDVDIKPKKKSSRKRKMLIDSIAENIIHEIAEHSSSFEDFIQKCGEFMEVNSYYKEFYLSITKTACNLDKISWNEIETAMNNSEGIDDFNVSKKVACSQYVKNAFYARGSQITILTFFEEVKKYKDYNFVTHLEDEEHESAFVEETAGANQEKTFAEETADVNQEKVFLEGFTGEEYGKVDEYQYQVFPKEFVEEIQKRDNFQGKVFWVLDTIYSQYFQDTTYISNRISICRVFAKYLKKYDNIDEINTHIKNSLKKYCYSEESHYILLARIYQAIKNYCVSVGYISENWNEVFFSDLKSFM